MFGKCENNHHLIFKTTSTEMFMKHICLFRQTISLSLAMSLITVVALKAQILLFTEVMWYAVNAEE